ncbi:uncharacterized protein G6M90_00g073530 [Metarhizium brunneum]|uniref:Uncharacterized protein n=1 Tax=Metarhizium brunneum TaxID=500148 RepID=A0A7D5V103_9HYPO|nr:hypothetical protein G6M90_00g073530 [Metarhizium brunneum]
MSTFGLDWQFSALLPGPEMERPSLFSGFSQKYFETCVLGQQCSTTLQLAESQLDELEALNILITEVEAEAAAEQDALRDTPAGALSLRYCKKAAKELEDVIQNPQRNIKWPVRLPRTAAKFGAVLSQKTILDAQRQLSKAFQMLQFAVTSKRLPERTASAFPAKKHEINTAKVKHTPTPTKIASASVELVSPQQATLRWLSGSVFGGIAGAQCSQVVQEGRDDGEEVRTAWDILSYRSSRSFTWKLTSWNVVPGDSPILEAVKRGPFTDVMALISSGDASLYDRDDNGKTLLHYAVYCRKFDTAINVIKTGHPVVETDNLGLFPCTAPSASPQADATKSLELLSVVISSGDFSNLLEGLIDDSATVAFFKPSQFDRLIWVVPGFLELIDNDLSWNFSQLPLSSKSRTFGWSMVRADTLDAILSRYSITLQDARQMLDYSVGHSLHEFAAQYLVQPNFRKTLPGSWRYAWVYDGETNGNIAVKNAQLWKGYGFGLVSAMVFDYLVKE